MDKTVYRDKDVQKILGCSNSKMQKLRKHQIIPFTQIGKAYYILRKDFEDWLSKNAGKAVI